MASSRRDVLHFSLEDQTKINAYLPPQSNISKTLSSNLYRPWVTLTFATSLDSQLSLAPGVRTSLSGPSSKAMTHYLRSKHTAILIGAGTAIADDPGLNCRLEGVDGYGGENVGGQPRPIILDPKGRWEFDEDSKVVQLAKEGKGLGPWIMTFSEDVSDERRQTLMACGGKFITMSDCGSGMAWNDILAKLHGEQIESVMIEGGGHVINSLLAGQNSRYIDSVIITIAPTWLGRGGVVVSPNREHVELPAARLQSVSWQPLGEDIVLCGYLNDASRR